MKPSEKRALLDISRHFKLSLVIILIALVAIRLIFILYYLETEIISEKFVLSFALAIMIIIWFQDNYDRRILSNLNKNLIKIQDELKKANLNTIKTLVSTVEAKDPYTSGHCDRVTDYALKICEEMNLPESFKEIVKNAGELHDVGKLKISDSILNKPENLNQEEWEILKKHPGNAVEILTPLKFLDKEKEIILHHHERFDGSGYPDGLKSKEIPLGSRILAVADSFDAMNSSRAYRKRLSQEKIMEELQNSKNTQHDDKIVDIFLRLLGKNGDFFFAI